MIRRSTIMLTLVAAVIWSPVQVAAQEAATPEDVIAKVREAAAYLAKNGKDGLAVLGSPDSPFIWKDTYVFVYSCAEGYADVAHPIPGTKPNKITADKDAVGMLIGPDMCRAASRPNGGWVEYKWWEIVPGEAGKKPSYSKKVTRKVTYMLNVKGQPYDVGAGIYNSTMTADELDALLRK